MTAEELENNLGTIAKSGSLAFKQENEAKEDIDIIGQFGVGFYSAFMVADHVKVVSRPYGSEQAWCWESDGADGYTLEETTKDSFGTDVILTMKKDTEDEKFSDYLESYRLSQLVKKYSDYIRYPIKMVVEGERLKEGTGKDGKDPEYETYTEDRTLNSMCRSGRRARAKSPMKIITVFIRTSFLIIQRLLGLFIPAQRVLPPTMR